MKKSVAKSEPKLVGWATPFVTWCSWCQRDQPHRPAKHRGDLECQVCYNGKKRK